MFLSNYINILDFNNKSIKNTVIEFLWFEIIVRKTYKEPYYTK